MSFTARAWEWTFASLQDFAFGWYQGVWEKGPQRVIDDDKALGLMGLCLIYKVMFFFFRLVLVLAESDGVCVKVWMGFMDVTYTPENRIASLYADVCKSTVSTWTLPLLCVRKMYGSVAFIWLYTRALAISPIDRPLRWRI